MAEFNRPHRTLRDYTTYLPAHLVERSRSVVDTPTDRQGKCVLYWMRSALRADENPALDVAVLSARHLQLPLLVYQGLSQRYAYASDRHHMFILQGARDVERSLLERGIRYAFHLERPGHDGDYLRQLVTRAAAVVTEDMPTGSPVHFLRALTRACKTPITAVDTACVVPMQLVGKAHNRAFEFRNKTKPLYQERVTREWPQLTEKPKPYECEQLPFRPVDLQSADLAYLVAQCEIDHAVGPVVDTIGGTVAGYNRWEHFRQTGLRAYAKKRNNALLDGVSRLSPYLHYGMVSPMRIARETAKADHDGARKYLDELLIWRELAYCFCFYRKDHDRWSALPDWARATLMQHAADPRPELFSWEPLARGETGHRLWDAAQKSLLIHGELHNNVRMTWGKALLNWTRTPQEALRFLVDLNHRYALDGRDPASYGGILWCLGQFDRPFSPEQPIIGTIRPRPIDDHAKRLNPESYWQKTTTLRSRTTPQVAVIGAGISGACAARTVRDHGLPVTLFEKSRGTGGRMATRRSGELSFDHGAQYFTVRDKRFRQSIGSWVEQGLVQPWEGEIAVFENGVQTGVSTSIERFVGVPGMNAIAKHLTRSLDVRLETTVDCVQQIGEKMVLIDAQGHQLGHFDRVIVSPPAPQAAQILRHIPTLVGAVAEFQLDPCWAVMIQLSKPLAVDWSGAFVNSGPIRWVARNQTKPGRCRSPETLVIHATADWTTQHLAHDSSLVAKALIDAFWQATGLDAEEPTAIDAHRWRYANPVRTASARCLTSESRKILVCGDWAGGPRVEGAFLSGMSAAGFVLRSLEGKDEAIDG